MNIKIFIELQKINKMKKYITYILVLVTFASCEDVIEVELNEQDSDLYAVEAKITTLDKPWVFLQMPVTVDKPFAGLSEAIVTISDDQIPANEITLVEDYERKGYYIVSENEDYYGFTNREYTVTIQTDEGITLTATEYLYPVEPIDSIQVRPSLRGDERFLAIFTYGKETPGFGNYYKWDIFINNTLLHDAHLMFFSSDEFVDGNYLESLEIFTDFHNPNENLERKLKFMDTVYVHQTSITEFAYDFYYQMFYQSETGYLFSVPPANITGNFTSSDGKEVLGLFTAHDISVSNNVIIDESIEGLLNERP